MGRMRARIGGEGCGMKGRAARGWWRAVSVFAIALLLAAPGRPLRAEPLPDAELESKIRELEHERSGVRLTGPIVGVAAGAFLLQGGLSSIVSIQYNCPGYWDCSDETRWGLTAGAGAAIVVGAIVIAIAGPVLSKRLRARRDLRQEIRDLRAQKSETLSRAPALRWTLGFGATEERRDVRVLVRY